MRKAAVLVMLGVLALPGRAVAAAPLPVARQQAAAATEMSAQRRPPAHSRDPARRAPALSRLRFPARAGMAAERAPRDRTAPALLVGSRLDTATGQWGEGIAQDRHHVALAGLDNRGLDDHGARRCRSARQHLEASIRSPSPRTTAPPAQVPAPPPPAPCSSTGGGCASAIHTRTSRSPGRPSCGLTVRPKRLRQSRRRSPKRGAASKNATPATGAGAAPSSL